MRRLLLSLFVVAFMSAFVTPPPAAAQQSFSFYVGGFTPTALDARGTDDVLYQNGLFLSTLNSMSGIDIRQFDHATVGGEWLFGITRNVEAGLGIGYYQRSVPTTYTDVVNANGSEIQQDLKLRIVPFSATIRLVPFGLDSPIQPYIGAGANVYAWRYSETGQFVDNQDNIFSGSFVGSGGAVGPVVLGGVRVPVGDLNVGGEVRWQGGKATLPTSEGFAGPKINLGGFNYLFTMGVRF